MADSFWGFAVSAMYPHNSNIKPMVDLWKVSCTWFWCCQWVISQRTHLLIWSVIVSSSGQDKTTKDFLGWYRTLKTARFARKFPCHPSRIVHPHGRGNVRNFCWVYDIFIERKMEQTRFSPGLAVTSQVEETRGAEVWGWRGERRWGSKPRLSILNTQIWSYLTNVFLGQEEMIISRTLLFRKQQCWAFIAKMWTQTP